MHKCTVCHKEFARANHLKRHQTSHSSIKPFKCTSCPKSFNRRDHLNQHEKLHQRSNDYECDICQKPFIRANLLAKHKASKHGIGEKICVSTNMKQYQIQNISSHLYRVILSNMLIFKRVWFFFLDSFYQKNFIWTFVLNLLTFEI